MCDQCLTQAVPLWRGRDWAVATVRKPSGVYAVGDLLVIQCNDPDFILRGDLFTAKEFEVDFGSKVELPPAVRKWFASYGLANEDPDHIYHPEIAARWANMVPLAAFNFEKEFGRPSSEAYVFSWQAWVVVKIVAELGGRVPLGGEKRAVWANSCELTDPRFLLWAENHPEENLRDNFVAFHSATSEVVATGCLLDMPFDKEGVLIGYVPF